MLDSLDREGNEVISSGDEDEYGDDEEGENELIGDDDEEGEADYGDEEEAEGEYGDEDYDEEDEESAALGKRGGASNGDGAGNKRQKWTW